MSLSTAPETMTARNQGSLSRDSPDTGWAPAPTRESPYSVARAETIMAPVCRVGHRAKRVTYAGRTRHRERTRRNAPESSEAGLD